MFNHEKFEAYHLAITYWEQALRLIEQIPSGNSNIKEQLKRVVVSISLNIAEGSGRNKNDDRKRFYAIARGSALECAAISDLIARLEPGLKAETDRTKDILHSIASILSAVILK